MRFSTLFLQTHNEHLTKDVGAIPYHMMQLKNYDSEIITYCNDADYFNLDKNLKGVRLEFVKRTIFGEIFDGAVYLLCKSKRIDILNLYHLSTKNVLWASIYKLVNSNGSIYLKTDASRSSVEKLKHSRIRYLLMRFLLSITDVVSVESKYVMYELKQVIDREYILIPNGVFKCNKGRDIPLKNNTILFVGRVDGPEKNVNLLIDAFLSAKIENDWKLKLVGPVSKIYIDQIKKKYNDSFNIDLDRVEFYGAVYDRNELDNIYKKSAIFVLPSEFESYGIVLVEALNCGCYLIGSESIPSFDEITNHYQYGCAINPHSINDFSECLRKAALDHVNDIDRINEQVNYCALNYSWLNIVEKLETAISKCKSR